MIYYRTKNLWQYSLETCREPTKRPIHIDSCANRDDSTALGVGQVSAHQRVTRVFLNKIFFGEPSCGLFFYYMQCKRYAKCRKYVGWHNHFGFGDYCRSCNFRVFKFSRITDHRTFHEVKISIIFFFFISAFKIIIFTRFLNSRIYPTLPRPRSSRKLKPSEYYQINSIWQG